MKINKNINFPKCYCFSSQFSISVFPISQNCSLHHWFNCHTSHLLANTLQPDFIHFLTWPFWNNYFFKISIGLLIPRPKCLFLELILFHFSETFERWIPPSFFWTLFTTSLFWKFSTYYSWNNATTNSSIRFT